MLLRMEEEQGITPPALERRPTLDKYQTWLKEEFGRLSRDRRYNESGPLPLTTLDIRAYYDAFQMYDFEFDNFHLWMTTIDDIWLEQVTIKREKAQKAPTTNHKVTR